MNIRLIHISCGPPEIGPIAPPATAKARYLMERRLERLGARMSASAGTTMNMNWLGWFDQWQTVNDALNEGASMNCEHCEQRISQAEFLVTIGQPLSDEVAKGIKSWECAECGDGTVTVKLHEPIDFVLVDIDAKPSREFVLETRETHR